MLGDSAHIRKKNLKNPIRSHYKWVRPADNANNGLCLKYPLFDS